MLVMTTKVSCFFDKTNIAPTLVPCIFAQNRSLALRQLMSIFYNMKKLYAVLFCLLFGATSALAQQAPNFFSTAQESDIRIDPKLRAHWPSTYQVWQLDLNALSTALQTAPQEFSKAADGGAFKLRFPNAMGMMETYKVWKTAMMEADLAAAYPEIQTYAGMSVEHPGRSIRFTLSPRGLRVMHMRADMGIEYMEPYVFGQTQTYYICYDRANLDFTARQDFTTGVLNENTPDPAELLPYAPPAEAKGTVVEENLRMKIYRIVISANGEFSQDHGGTKPLVLSALTEYINFVSGFFERDATMRLQLASITNNVIFLDPNTDPFTGQLVEDWMSQNPGVLNTYTSSLSHDVGHVFARYITGGAIGVAGGFACTDTKGRGCSAGNGNNDYGDFFLNVIGQEIGHQLAGGHTWNRCNGGAGRFGNVAFEPGSGSTIMSYAGACGSDNVQSNSDLYYHVGSIEEFRNYYTFFAGVGCGSFLETTNKAPIVSLPYTNNFFIPISTPFELNGSAIDPDGQAVNYCWEEVDAGPETPLGQPAGNAAIFRTRPAVEVGNRYFPRLSTVITNGFDKTEQLPTYTRDLSFRLTARDNQPNGGGVGWETVEFKAFEGAGPFLVQSPNASSTTWRVGEYAEVKWDVANTFDAPVNCKHVNIRLSLDGGQTYPVTLASGVDNDGSHYVLVPNNVSSIARVRVDAADNVFFDISNANFKIQLPQQPSFSASVVNDYEKICLPPVFTTEILTAGIMGFNTPVELSIAGVLPAGAVASFNKTILTPGENSLLTVDLSDVTEKGVYKFDVQIAVPGLDTLLRSVTLDFVWNDFSDMALSQPGDGTKEAALVQTLRWQKSVNAERYDVQLATNPAFSPADIVSEQFDISIDSFKVPLLLQKNKAYYWRVRPVNSCAAQAWLEPFFFSTFAESCTDVQAFDLPKPIAAGAATTIESNININAGATISDINVSQLKGTHSYFGDLEVKLRSPQGTEITLFKNRCSNYSGAFNIYLDDAAATNLTCPPSSGTPGKPLQALSAFNGQSATGSWRLSVKDNVAGSGGTLSDFHLEICATLALNPPFLVNNNPLLLSSGADANISADLLRVDDADDPHTALVYTLMSTPAKGALRKIGGSTDLKAGDKFTQADLDNGLIRYFDFGTNPGGQDQFRFIVSDGKGGFLGTLAFLIQPATVSTDEAFQTLNVRLLPNPATNTVNLLFAEEAAANTQVAIFSINGQCIGRYDNIGGARNLNISVADWPNGIYLVQIRSAKGSAIEKLLKQ